MKRYYIILVALAFILAGCRSGKVAIVESVRIDTTYITKVERDSIYLHDSIASREERRGDTLFVYLDKWHTKVRYITRLDTIYKSRVDTIPVPVEIVKEVARKRGLWEYFILLGFIGFLVFFIKRVI